jgi:ABC-type glycerol-3-phosphate transport system substrate-binding protein
MSRLSRLIPALAIALVLAACSDSGSTPLSPDGPSYEESGVGSAGGNRGDTTTITTTQTDTTSRSGVGSAGGN